MNVFDEIDRLCSEWEQSYNVLPIDARRILNDLARSIVLEAGKVCESRASSGGRNPTAGMRGNAPPRCGTPSCATTASRSAACTVTGLDVWTAGRAGYGG